MENLTELVILIMAVITVLTTVGWVAAYKSVRNIIQNTSTFITKYRLAMQDKEITPEELQEFLPNLLCIIQESASIWTMLVNLFFRLIPIFKKFRR